MAVPRNYHNYTTTRGRKNCFRQDQEEGAGYQSNLNPSQRQVEISVDFSPAVMQFILALDVTIYILHKTILHFPLADL